MSALDSFPERSRPLDVIVTIKIAAADRGGRKLELPEKEADHNGADEKLDDSDGRLRLEPGEYAGGGRHQSFNRFFCVSSQLIDQIE